MVLISKALKYYGFVVLVLSSQLGIAQTCEKKLTLAKQYYQIGQLDTIIQLKFNNCSNDQKIEFLHLQAEAHAALSKLYKAQQLIEQILSINRRYRPKITDSKRLKKLYQAIKRQNNKDITYAISKSADSLIIAPTNITTISQKEIEQRGYQNLAEIFQDIAGFSVVNSTGTNLIYNRGIRNIKETEGILILVDGLEYNNIWSQTIPLDDRFSISNINKIEILNGPQSTFYGANALTTVINIVTKKASSILPYQESSGLVAQITKQIETSNPILGSLSTADLTFMVDLGSESILTLNGKYTYNAPNNSVNLDPYIPKDSSVYRLININNLSSNQLMAMTELDRIAYNNQDTLKSLSKPHTYASFSAALDIENFKLTVNFQDIMNETTNLFADRRKFGILNSAYHDRIGGFSLQFNKFVANNFYINTMSSYRIEHSVAYNNRLLSYQTGDLLRNDLSPNPLDSSAQPTVQQQTYTQQSQEFKTEINMEYSGISWMDLIVGLDFRGSLLQANYQIERNITNKKNYHFFNTNLKLTDYNFQQNNRYSLASYIGTNINHKAIPNLYISLGLRYEGYTKTLNNYHFGDDAYYKAFINFYEAYYTTTYPRQDQPFFNFRNPVTLEFIPNAYSKKVNGLQFILSPRLILLYDLLRTNNKNLIVKLLYNEGFQTMSQSTRFGTTSDLIYNNPFISRPTIAKNKELNINYNTNNWQTSATYFNTKYNNVLTTRSYPTNALINPNNPFFPQGALDNSLLGVFTDTVNLNAIELLIYDQENVHAQGFQVDAKVKLALTQNADLDLFANYAYTKSTNEIDTNIVALRKQKIPGIAQHQFNIGANFLTLDKRLNINIRMNYVGNRSFEGEDYAGLPSISKANIPAYAVFHSAITYYLPKQHLGFQLIVRNIFNTNYYHPGIGSADGFYYKSSIEQPRRQFFFKTLFDLNRFDVFHRPIF